MLKVEFDRGLESSQLSIYIGENNLIASTAWWKYPLKEFKPDDVFYFNHTHGSCYFLVDSGSNDYTLKITKLPYQPLPILYNKEPSSHQVISELDTIVPKANILDGSTNMNTLYRISKKSNGLSSAKQQVVAMNGFNENTYPAFDFSKIPNSQNGTQNDMQFSLGYTDGVKQYESFMVPFIPDESPPICDSIAIDLSEYSVEIKVSNARDDAALAQRPYRYRVYSVKETAPNYTDWLTSDYYCKGIEGNEMFQKGLDYIMDVQIRDVTAEKYQNDVSKNLSNHISTYTQKKCIAE